MDVRNPVQTEMRNIVVLCTVAEKIKLALRGYHLVRTYQIGLVPAGMELEICPKLVIGK